MFHTQWCSALAMVAVEWPNFICVYHSTYQVSSISIHCRSSFDANCVVHAGIQRVPSSIATLFILTSESDITLVQTSRSRHWNPLATLPYSPPSNFADQLADQSSPLYIDPSAPNLLFTLPDNGTSGITAFAYTIGLHPHDLFNVCLIIFFGIIAAAIVVSFLVWLVDYVACLIGGTLGGNANGQLGLTALNRIGGTRSPNFGNKEPTETTPLPTEENKSSSGHTAPGTHIFRPASRFTLPLSGGGSTTGERGINSHRAWWRFRSDISSFHGSVLHGNLVRILVLFHLPVTIFSSYQMTLPRSEASLTSIVLAGLSFAILSVLIPAHLVLRVTFTTTNKLYDETRTLLSFGPLYNHYRHGSQMFASLFFATNLIFGVTIGAGQASGTAQAIIILVVEVVSALVTSVWLPWGSGASMGLISFLFCVARIVIAVLLVILTPTVSLFSSPLPREQNILRLICRYQLGQGPGGG